MIGGKDIVALFGGSGEVVLGLVTEAICEVWPEAVIISAEPLEWFVYRDELAHQRWNRDGASPENANTMIHLIAEPWNALTLVLDDPTAPAAQAALRRVMQIVIDTRPGTLSAKTLKSLLRKPDRSRDQDE